MINKTDILSALIQHTVLNTPANHAHFWDCELGGGEVSGNPLGRAMTSRLWQGCVCTLGGGRAQQEIMDTAGTSVLTESHLGPYSDTASL